MRRLTVLLTILSALAVAAPTAGAAGKPAQGTPRYERMVERQARQSFAVFRRAERTSDVPRLQGEDAVLNPIFRRAWTRRIVHAKGFDAFLAVNARGIGPVCVLLVTPGAARINHECADDVSSFLASAPHRTARLPDGRVAVVLPVADGASPALLLSSDWRLLASLPPKGNALAAVVPEHQVIALLNRADTGFIAFEAVSPEARSAPIPALTAP